MTSIIFSYSHADDNLRDTLEKHLSGLKHQGHQGQIHTWHDRCVRADNEFNSDISDLTAAAKLLAIV